MGIISLIIPSTLLPAISLSLCFGLHCDISLGVIHMSLSPNTALNTTGEPTGLNASTPALRGWVDQPNGRGTIDILWSCASTFFVCVWVMLHLNVPAPEDTIYTLFWRKIKWVVWALLAPELLMLFASGQWASAKRSVVDMKALGYEDWSMIHAFYADSGGFVFQARGSQAFPVTAKQVWYLVQAKYMQIPSITTKEIWDKSKVDRVGKTIAGLQAGWLIVQVIARGVQHLPITLLELSTVAILVCTGATFFFWFYKPLNVGTPTILYSNTSVKDILIQAGSAANVPFRDTPLDFVESHLYTSSQMPLHRCWGVQKRPLPRIPNDRDSRLHNLSTVVVVTIPTAAFSLLHLVAWHFHFPTRLEQLCWRWTCVAMCVVLASYCTVEAISIVWDGYTTTGLTTLNGYKLKWPTNILFFGPAVLYMSARMVVIGEICFSLRLLPSGCFETISWSEFLPHL